MHRFVLAAVLCSATVVAAACSVSTQTTGQKESTQPEGGGASSSGVSSGGASSGGASSSGASSSGASSGGASSGGASSSGSTSSSGGASSSGSSSGGHGDGGGSGSGGSHDAGADASDGGPFVPAAHPPWPQVPANEGVVMHSMKLVTVVASGDALASDYFAFGDALVASQWWSSFSTEYGLGTPTQNVHVTGAAMTKNPNEAAMKSYIEAAIAGTPAAAADGNTLYMLYLPPGISILDDSSGNVNTNCDLYQGYHDAYDKSGDAFGVGQQCPIANTGLTQLQSMTLIASHEIAEAASDPVPGSGWAPPSPNTSAPWLAPAWNAAIYGEIGDLCFTTQITEGSYMYQRIWSNAAAAKGGDPCVPAFPQPYVNTSVPEQWYTIAPGGSLQIPVTGFSDRATADWWMWATPYTSSDSSLQFTATVTSPTEIVEDAGTWPTTNNGRQATLTVTAPAGATSGTWATVLVESYPLVNPNQDPFELWILGVYVP